MTSLHGKSPCCRARVIRFGERRRQCTQCRRTWRTWQKRRGPKRTRVYLPGTLNRFESGSSLRHVAQHRQVNREQLRRRQHAGMTLLLRRLPPPPIPRGQLIAVIDGLRFRFSGEECTLYLLLLRAVHSKRAVLQEPLLLRGHESLRGWQQVFSHLPVSAHQRIVALVSDGLTRIEALAEREGWVHQCCHFHLLTELRRFRGHRTKRRSPDRPLREAIYRSINILLTTPPAREVHDHLALLARLLANPACPRWLRSRARGFLQSIDAFRAYQRFPRLHLPATTNTAECAGSLLRRLLSRTRGFRTAASCQRWMVLFVKVHHTFQCNGKNDQPN